MTRKPANLRVVQAQPEVIDLYDRWRADIAARNWSAVHIAGDRRQPIYLDERPRWKGWLK